MPHAVSPSFQKPYHIKVYFRPKLFMQLCIMDIRIQSPDWRIVTVNSIKLLSTSTSTRVLSSIVSGTMKLETRELLD